MKGVIRAGGSGSRLYSLTRATNKYLLSVFNQPPIFYPLHTLIPTVIIDTLILVSPHHACAVHKANSDQYSYAHNRFDYKAVSPVCRTERILDWRI